MLSKIGNVAAATLAFMCVFAVPALADDASLLGNEPDRADVALGMFNLIQNHGGKPSVPEARIEYRLGSKWLDIGPAAGILANTQAGVFGYIGIYADIALGNFVITPLAGAGAYGRGNSEDLGGSFEFRLSLDASYQFADQSRLGLQYGHISNAGLNRRNPGDNELLLTYSIAVL